MGTYVVTGANRGLGLEFCRQLLGRGDRVIAGCRKPEDATELNALRKAHDALTVHALDTVSDESVAEFAKAVGETPVDVIINNAGVWGGEKQRLGNMDYEAFAHTLNVNTIGPVRVLDALKSNLIAGGRKVAVTITSGMGSIEDNTSGGYFAYRASKAGVNAAMRSAAWDLRGDGVTVFVMNPGWVQTDMGGPSASITPTTSIEGMLKVIDGAGAETNGTFQNYNGGSYAW